MNRFENQTAVITGGAQGIGLSIGRKLAFEGAKIWIFDMDEETARGAVEAMGEEGLKVDYAKVDITSEASVEGGFEAVADAGDTVQIVVNSAGIVGPSNLRTEEVPLEGFEKTIAVNLTGSFLMLKYALKAMAPQNYGRILLIASIAGKEGNAGMVSYSSSKAGVIGMVKAAGKEYAETGITVNGLAPAVIRTAMVENMPEAQVKYMTDKIPMKRCGTLDEVANLAAWIVSEESSFNTAFTFDMTGGRAVY